jgi:Tripartite tricarboxylate transporter family receptor
LSFESATRIVREHRAATNIACSHQRPLGGRAVADADVVESRCISGSARIGARLVPQPPGPGTIRRHTEINAGLADPKIKARLADFGGTPLVGSPAGFGKLIADETEKWGKVVRAANIKPD